MVNESIFFRYAYHHSLKLVSRVFLQVEIESIAQMKFEDLPGFKSVVFYDVPAVLLAMLLLNFPRWDLWNKTRLCNLKPTQLLLLIPPKQSSLWCSSSSSMIAAATAASTTPFHLQRNQLYYRFLTIFMLMLMTHVQLPSRHSPIYPSSAVLGLQTPCY